MDYVWEFMGFHLFFTTRSNLLLWAKVLYRMFTHVQRSFPVANWSCAEIICNHLILLPEFLISGDVLAAYQFIVEERSQVFCTVLQQRTALRLHPSTSAGTTAVSETERGIIKLRATKLSEKRKFHQWIVGQHLMKKRETNQEKSAKFC